MPFYPRILQIQHTYHTEYQNDRPILTCCVDRFWHPCFHEVRNLLKSILLMAATIQTYFFSELYVIPEVDWAKITILPDQPSSCELEPLKTALTAATKSDSSKPLTPDLTEKLGRLQTFIRGYNLTAEIQGNFLKSSS